MIQDIANRMDSFRLVRFATAETADYLDFPGLQEVSPDFITELRDVSSQYGANAILLSNHLKNEGLHRAVKAAFPESVDLPCVSSMGIECQDSFDDYGLTIGKESKRNLVRIARKMDQMKAIFSMDELTQEDFNWLLFHQKLRAEAMGYDHLEKTMVQRVISKMVPNSQLQFASIRLNNETIAAMIIFQSEKTLAIYSQAFDMAYSKLYPSLFLLKELIDYCCDHGYTYLDLLRGEETYKQRFCNREIPLVKTLTYVTPEKGNAPILSFIKDWIE